MAAIVLVVVRRRWTTACFLRHVGRFDLDRPILLCISYRDVWYLCSEGKVSESNHHIHPAEPISESREVGGKTRHHALRSDKLLL